VDCDNVSDDSDFASDEYDVYVKQPQQAVQQPSTAEAPETVQQEVQSIEPPPPPPAAHEAQERSRSPIPRRRSRSPIARRRSRSPIARRRSRSPILRRKSRQRHEPRVTRQFKHVLYNELIRPLLFGSFRTTSGRFGLATSLLYLFTFGFHTAAYVDVDVSGCMRTLTGECRGVSRKGRADLYIFPTP
jgi:hypothetical protein